jgi:hypothetical protein
MEGQLLPLVVSLARDPPGVWPIKLNDHAVCCDVAAASIFLELALGQARTRFP